jgi:hypothetical protein
VVNGPGERTRGRFALLASDRARCRGTQAEGDESRAGLEAMPNVSRSVASAPDKSERSEQTVPRLSTATCC